MHCALQKVLVRSEFFINYQRLAVLKSVYLHEMAERVTNCKSPAYISDDELIGGLIIAGDNRAMLMSDPSKGVCTCTVVGISFASVYREIGV